ncbi:MAG TPA: protein translocase subunit SecD [Acidimicrobiales bacterium]|nr:protein translocase subunit SecD [Acidimicrobiales bacterium]
MRRRRNAVSLLLILAVAFGSLTYTLVQQNEPALGLDLQGGISLVLSPAKKVKQGVLTQSISIIRNRVDALGVGEPEITRQGNNILVELPGVKDQDKAREVVGRTAELRFRPVSQPGIPPEDYVPPTTTTAKTKKGATTTTSDPAATTTTTEKPVVIPSTKPEDDVATETVLLPMKKDKDGKVSQRLQLGPALLTGEVVRTARAAFSQDRNEWYVQLFLTGKGSPAFDAMAAANQGKQIAIVLDGVVQSAPTIQAVSFDGKPTITGTFSQSEAKDLALVLRYGALPVQLKEESVEKISATLGKDSLRAGIIAGAIGLALVLLYMVLYYRALGLVVVLGLTVSASLLWSIIGYLGENSGLALSLAGATGIIVSIGVTVDSYVVFFERLKDELRSGKTIRSSVDRGFSKAYRTILAADISSLIGAGVLYLLTVGPVRGFAFFLGLSTLLDLFVAYFFTRPMVAILANNRAFTQARGLGVARGLATTEASF